MKNSQISLSALKGFHTAPAEVIAKIDGLELITINTEKSGAYRAVINYTTMSALKTFFPIDWALETVIEKVRQACANPIQVLNREKWIICEGQTEEGMVIRAVISPEDSLILAYPVVL